MSFHRPRGRRRRAISRQKLVDGINVFSQDAKYIAIQYAGTAIGIGLVALVMSWVIRLQLAFPRRHPLHRREPLYQAVTMHGMIMVVYMLTAIFLGGFGNYLIPLMVGARDMVFPYVNMLSYWVYLLATLVLVASSSCLAVQRAPAGRFLSATGHHVGHARQRLRHHSHAGVVDPVYRRLHDGRLNYVVTVLQGRTRGMTLMRMPLTVWGIFAAAVMALLAFPGLFVACVMLLLDRTLGTSFSCQASSRVESI